MYVCIWVGWSIYYWLILIDEMRIYCSSIGNKPNKHTLLTVVVSQDTNQPVTLWVGVTHTHTTVTGDWLWVWPERADGRLCMCSPYVTMTFSCLHQVLSMGQCLTSLTFFWFDLWMNSPWYILSCVSIKVSAKIYHFILVSISHMEKEKKSLLKAVFYFRFIKSIHSATSLLHANNL